jgi:hypothetical protein
MGLRQLLISFIFCNNSFLRLWYVRILPLVILSYHEFRLYFGLTLITIISELIDTCEGKKKLKKKSTGNVESLMTLNDLNALGIC